MSAAEDDVAFYQALRAERARRDAEQEREELPKSLSKFIAKGWHVLNPEVAYHHNWHIEAICDKLQAVSEGEILRLQIWVPPGSMKPVDENALVLMGDGERKPLRDIAAGDYVITHMGRPRRVVEVHEQGDLETIQITTRAGRTVAAAADHPFLTPDGWVEAGNLRELDVLGLVSDPDITAHTEDRLSTESLSLEEMRLIGYFIGDGNTCKGERSIASNITCVDDLQGNDIVHCAESLGFIARKSNQTNQTMRATRYDISNGVRQWLRDNDLAGKSSWTKRVPSFVFLASKEQIAHLIGAYFSCDGTIGHWRQGEKRSSATVIFNSVNRPLLEDIQHLLLRLGIRSRIAVHRARRNNFTGGEHISWRLTIQSLDDTTKFIQTVPVIGAKAERLQSLSLQKTRFAERVIPDVIVAVESGGTRKCRCLTVEEDGSFTANDLIVKNTGTVSVFWHPWEWTTRPWLRYWSASYETRLAGRMSAMSRALMMSDWYQLRWGDNFSFSREGEFYYSNDRGGTRLATAPRSTGTGEHGHRIIVDDPIKADAADATSRVTLDEANNWYDSTLSTRGIDIGFKHARVIVMQRLHQDDLAGHVLEQEEWTILCLPERYEPNHPFVWPDDPRQEGDLLWPDHRDEQASNALAKTLTSHRAAGQLQQRPAAREGEILKRDWWRFYDPRIREKEKWNELGRFGLVVISVDTPLKDKESNDNVSVQCWGIKGADRYLLDLRLGKMNYSLAKRTIREMALWARRLWRGCSHYILIENAGYGVELITDLKRELTGVQKIPAGVEGNKVQRAEAASDGLESGNYFLPGFGPPWQPAYDEHRTPADISAFIDNAALFPNARHDDDVDAWSQLGNWLRDKQVQPIRTSRLTRRLTAPLR